SSSSRALLSRSRKPASPTWSKMALMLAPVRCSMNASASTKSRPKRSAMRRPMEDLPAPIGPTSTRLGAGFMATDASKGARSRLKRSAAGGGARAGSVRVACQRLQLHRDHQLQLVEGLIHAMGTTSHVLGEQGRQQSAHGFPIVLPGLGDGSGEQSLPAFDRGHAWWCRWRGVKKRPMRAQSVHEWIMTAMSVRFPCESSQTLCSIRYGQGGGLGAFHKRSCSLLCPGEGRG